MRAGKGSHTVWSHVKLITVSGHGTRKFPTMQLRVERKSEPDATYEEAAKNGKEVLDLLIETWEKEGRPLPPPRFFVSDAVPA